MALRRNRDQIQNDSIREQITQRGNYIAILNTIATLYAQLKQHLESGAKSAKMISQEIQIILCCLANYIPFKIKEEIFDYYATIANLVTDRYSNNEMLLLCLLCVGFSADGTLNACEPFFVSLTKLYWIVYRVFQRWFRTSWSKAYRNYWVCKNKMFRKTKGLWQLLSFTQSKSCHF